LLSDRHKPLRDHPFEIKRRGAGQVDNLRYHLIWMARRVKQSYHSINAWNKRSRGQLPNHFAHKAWADKPLLQHLARVLDSADPERPL